VREIEKCYYYLHTNGDLIHKNYLDNEQVSDFRESGFVKMFWLIDITDRSTAWGMLIEAEVCGANEERLKELKEKWGITDADGKHYLDYLGLKLSQDGNQLCVTTKNFVNLQESPAGFGSNIFEALVALCRNLNYRPQKMWGNSFEDLIRNKQPPHTDKEE